MKKLFAVFMSLMFIICLAGCKESISTTEYLKINWNINISEEAKIIYELETFGGFNGDGFLYIIYELENKDLETLINNDFLYKTNLYEEKTFFLEYYIQQVNFIT